MEKKILVVIGGGAAGFFCAVNAATMNPDLKVLLLERSRKVLSKVKVSGGGRCNVTHACFEIMEMCRNYPRGGNFVKKTFHQFFTTDTIDWFKKRGVLLKTESDGRMFPTSDSSQSVIDCLLKSATSSGLELLMQADVKSISRSGDRFRMEVGEESRVLYADFVCIACGGFPKASMFEWLTWTGHSIEEPVPSLFTFNTPGHPITTLMGISIPHATIRISNSKLQQEGPILITHWGLSGPAVLKTSAWGARELAERKYDFQVQVNWIPEFNEHSLRERFIELRSEISNQKILNRNPFSLPQRLWEFLLNESTINGQINWADLPAKLQNKLITNLVMYTLQVKGKTTFKEEFVTAGGIRLSEIDPNTMMSKKVPNLYFAGEIMDVDGVTGGFNFQHAWTSGYIAAKSIAEAE